MSTIRFHATVRAGRSAAPICDRGFSSWSPQPRLQRSAWTTYAHEAVLSVALRCRRAGPAMPRKSGVRIHAGRPRFFPMT